MKCEILIIGKVPPPLGGVSVHVHRLISWLRKRNQLFDFSTYNFKSSISLVLKLTRSRVAHIHASRPIMRLILVTICKMLSVRSIFTYHGKIGQWGKFGNSIDKLSLMMVDIPIVLNKHSLSIASRYNYRAQIISAFIPPLDEDGLSIENLQIINNARCSSKILLCTNAFKMVYDVNGQETYGIIELVKFIASDSDFSLVISDPSGEYLKWFADGKECIPNNVYFISSPHSFYEVLKSVDCFVRHTTKDGDSLSVREAMYLGVPVVATDRIERPAGVNIFPYGDLSAMRDAVLNAVSDRFIYDIESSTVDDLIKLYKEVN